MANLNLLKVTAGSGINQIRGINRSGATGAGIPQHVTNVSTSMANASVGSTSTVSVTFRRDPTDVNFNGVTVWVKGYQGNQTPTQVASSADSPVNFILTNTGEALSIIVQAFGNGGSAPITTAPTAGLTLPKSTGGGVGTTTNTSTPAVNIALTVPTELSVSGSPISTGTGGTFAISKANESDHTVWAGPTALGATAQPTFRTLSVLDEYPFFATYMLCPFAAPGPATGINLVGYGAGEINTNGTGGAAFGGASNPEFAAVTYLTPVTASTSVFGSWATKAGISPSGGRPFTRLRQVAIRARAKGNTNIRSWVGWISLGVTGSTIDNMAADVPTNPAFVGFRFSSGTDTNWKAVSKSISSSSITVVDTGVAPDTTNYHTFIILFDGTTLKFYIDTTLVATIATNLPTGATATGGCCILTDNKNTANQQETDFTHHMERYDWK